MKLGTENKKQVIALAVLGTLAVLVVLFEYWPSSSTSPTAASQSGSATVGPKATRRTKSGKVIAVVEPRLDPTLDLGLLKSSEEIKYAGNGRNIFVVGSVATIPKPLRSGAAEDDDQRSGLRPPPFIPPPPPITLKFLDSRTSRASREKCFSRRAKMYSSPAKARL